MTPSESSKYLKLVADIKHNRMVTKATQVALKYDSMKKFEEHDKEIYDFAKANDILDDICGHMNIWANFIKFASSNTSIRIYPTDVSFSKSIHNIQSIGRLKR